MILRWLPTWVVPVLIVMAAGTVWLRLSIVRTTYDYNQTARIISNSKRELEQAELRLARARSPAHLEQLARTKFGLAPPKSEQVIYLGAPAPAGNRR